jgi:predicted phage terminase large subunit-like protein
MGEAALAYEPLPLLDFIPALSPKWSRPVHLAPVLELFERARRAAVFAFATTPPRHAKTESIKHAIVQRLLDDPTTRIAYCSYSDRAARKRSREIRKLYVRAGGQVDPKASSVSDWRTGHADGGLWAAGVGGSWTGEGFDLIVVDDPVKGRKQAESATERETLWDFFKDDLETRLEPGGSVIVVHTRWTTDDLGGRLIAGHGINPYEHVHLPALREVVNDNGEPETVALWPERWPIESLRKIEKAKGPYTWESLYQGRPFAKGGRVFDLSEKLLAAQTVDIIPAKLRISLGCDLAYSQKTHADWSVLVIIGVDDVTQRIYVLDVIRMQVKAPVFGARLKLAQEAYPIADIRWYYAGAELGITQFLETVGVELDAVPASADKFIRAQPVAAAWSSGRIFIPRGATWLEDFLAELGAFTGVDDLSDDQVDAFAAAFDSSEQPGWITAMQKYRARGGL